MKKIIERIASLFLVAFIFTFGITSILAASDSVDITLQVVGGAAFPPPSAGDPMAVLADVDSDGNLERATNADNNSANGYELFNDFDGSSTITNTIDGDLDGKVDYLINTGAGPEPEMYWDPDHNILFAIALLDVDGDGTLEYLFDSNKDGMVDKYFDPNTSQVYQITGMKLKDVDGDGILEIAKDDDNDLGLNGYELFIDSGGTASNAYVSKDLTGDGNYDFLIDTDSDGNPNVFWDPKNNKLSTLIPQDVDTDGTIEYLADINGSGIYNKYYDPNDGLLHDYMGSLMVADVDGDGNLEQALDSDASMVNGYEVFNDPDLSSTAIVSADLSNDGNQDFLIDINGNGVAEKYWSPVSRILTDLIYQDADGDPTIEYLIDFNNNGVYSKYYDPDTGLVYDMLSTKFRDVDADGVKEKATDLNNNLSLDGYESFNDGAGVASVAIIAQDISGDGNYDYLIDTNGDGIPNVYWDPTHDILTNIFLQDLDGDGTQEWLIDLDGNGVFEKYYDPNDGVFYKIVPGQLKEIKQVQPVEEKKEETKNIPTDEIALPVKLTLDSNNTVAKANGTDSILITVSARDAKGMVPKGLYIKLASDSKDDIFNPEKAPVDEKGFAYFSVKSSTPHASILRATPVDQEVSFVSSTLNINFTKYLVDETEQKSFLAGILDKIAEGIFLFKNNVNTKAFVSGTMTPVAVVSGIILAYLSLITLLQSLSDIIPLINYILNSILQLFGLAKKPKSWGTIYDSETKDPLELAIVRLVDATTGEIKQTQATDKLGRFSFDPVEGQYYLKVTKPNYNFPSGALKGLSMDKGYTSLYFGENIKLKTDQLINMSVPLDKFELQKLSRSFVDSVKSLFDKISTPLLVLGLAISVFALWVEPNVVNGVITGLYGGLIGLKEWLKLPIPKPAGFIVDSKTGKAVEGVAVKIYDAKYDKMIETKVSGKDGRFDFLLPPGEYYAQVASSGYKIDSGMGGRFYNGGKFTIQSEKNPNLRIPLTSA